LGHLQTFSAGTSHVRLRGQGGRAVSGFAMAENCGARTWQAFASRPRFPLRCGLVGLRNLIEGPSQNGGGLPAFLLGHRREIDIQFQFWVILTYPPG